MGFFKFINDVKHNFQHNSFKDVLIMTERDKTSAILGIDDNKTQLQRMEDFHRELGRTASKFTKVPFLGQIASEIQAGSQFAVDILDPVNRAIDEQDAASKQGKSGFKHFKGIGVSTGKALHKGHKITHTQGFIPATSHPTDAPVLQHRGEVEVSEGTIKKKQVVRRPQGLYIDDGFAEDQYPLKERDDFDSHVMTDRYFMQG